MPKNKRIEDLEKTVRPQQRQSPEITVIEVYGTDGVTETLRDRYVWNGETQKYELENTDNVKE